MQRCVAKRQRIIRLLNILYGEWQETQSFLSSENFVAFLIMPSNSRHTTRQRMLELLSGQELSARGLAIPVREVEDHLPHLVKTVRRHSDKQFLLIPSQCQDCGFAFGQRTRLTPPSRCPQCRSEFISPPRYRILKKASP